MRKLKKNKRYFTRYVLTDKGLRELKVSEEVAKKQIDKIMEEDKEMLEILEKL